LDDAFVPGRVDAAEVPTTFVDGDDEYAPTKSQLQPSIAAIEQARNSP
jgi:hypothetical protein